MVFCPIKLITRIKKILEEFEALTHSSLVCAHYQFVKMNRIETFMLCQMRFDLHLSDTLVRPFAFDEIRNSIIDVFYTARKEQCFKF